MLGSDGEGSLSTSESQADGAADVIKVPDDAYLMVCQTRWEDDVVWSSDESRAAVSQCKLLMLMTTNFADSL